MKSLLHLALAFTLFSIGLPVQAQNPERYPGLLDVTTPEEEAGSFIAGVCISATCESAPPFALPLEGVGPAPVVPSDPIDLCNPITNSEEFKGAFVLINARDSGCGDNFYSALRKLDDAGALGGIFYNGDAPSDDDASLFNIFWDATVLYPFPAVVITRYRGERLLAAIEAGEEVTAFMRMNPAVVSKESGAESENGLGLSVYPNPGASPGITLELERPESVRLAVYDVLGREVAALHDGVLGAGPHQFAVRSLPAGLYVVQAKGTSVQTVRRVTVLR